MSETSDRMNELDKQQKIITQALHKNEEVMKREVDEAEEKKKTEYKEKMANFLLGFLVLFLLMGLTVAFVLVFSTRTMSKVGVLSNAKEQLEVLLEEQGDEITRLDAHVKAVELEFRRALKKDRQDMADIQAALIERDQKILADMNKTLSDLRTDVLAYKTTVTDNESQVSQIERDYNDLMKRFESMRSEMKTLREKVMDLTVPRTLER